MPKRRKCMTQGRWSTMEMKEREDTPETWATWEEWVAWVEMLIPIKSSKCSSAKEALVVAMDSKGSRVEEEPLDSSFQASEVATRDLEECPASSQTWVEKERRTTNSISNTIDMNYCVF